MIYVYIIYYIMFLPYWVNLNGFIFEHLKLSKFKLHRNFRICSFISFQRYLTVCVIFLPLNIILKFFNWTILLNQLNSKDIISILPELIVQVPNLVYVEIANTGKNAKCWLIVIYIMDQTIFIVLKRSLLVVSILIFAFFWNF